MGSVVWLLVCFDVGDFVTGKVCLYESCNCKILAIGMDIDGSFISLVWKLIVALHFCKKSAPRMPSGPKSKVSVVTT